MDERERERQQAVGRVQDTERDELVSRLRLHEERAVVEILPQQHGAVTIRRVVTERQEVVPITLRSERLEITVQEGAGGQAMLNGEALEVGRTYEVPLYEERAQVEKQVYPLSDVTITKQARTYTQTEEITLRREELDVEDPQGLVRDRTMPEGHKP
ncbi:hypothetical protein DEIPH_ctg021orf0033 [Deinococcus phoenicis]|uniref:DUF2382 domain-containing protein n=1 Tax=Deinococcus phoenicis TaxID=1476583 RepID=A0A016QRK9_9DEIO|nr:YsnF/AvaK domain-containing protein [Deinococcus phoenicis]EYB68522.1 hypothetical protein DEIPH_ctg021orf0033 [Deinococcus phoenicis]